MNKRKQAKMVKEEKQDALEDKKENYCIEQQRNEIRNFFHIHE